MGQDSIPGPGVGCQADYFAGRRGCLRLNYIRAMERAGAATLLLPNSPDPDNAAAAAEVADGLLLSGGWDLNPSLYGQPRHPTVEHLDDVRDATELSAIAAARRRRIPILAICRGIQVLNVAMGGGLIQDIDDWAQKSPPASRMAHRAAEHEISIDSGTLTARLWGSRIRVNSRHHQALDRVAEGLKVTARSADGVVEAAESADGYPLLAVQCHPEDMWQSDARYLRPFEWLTSEALSGRG